MTAVFFLCGEEVRTPSQTAGCVGTVTRTQVGCDFLQGMASGAEAVTAATADCPFLHLHIAPLQVSSSSLKARCVPFAQGFRRRRAARRGQCRRGSPGRGAVGGRASIGPGSPQAKGECGAFHGVWAVLRPRREEGREPCGHGASCHGHSTSCRFLSWSQGSGCWRCQGWGACLGCGRYSLVHRN